MASGSTTSVGLVGAYLERIERLNPLVNAVRCLLPDAEERAAALDAERREGRVRGPLHGVPVLVKDNIDVAGIPTTAGALALEHSVPDRDADLVTRLREAGAVVIGKTNLTELANCMAENMPSGYSSLGGQVLNPYDVRYDPSGSSSGSGAAAALGLATVTVGTETDGSILSPSSNQSLVGLKPTLGLVPGRGILPIATSQDCAGPMCRTVADAAALLGVLTGETYGEGSGPDTLRGVRLAVPPLPSELHEQEAEVFGAAQDVLRDRGAVLVEVPALPETDELPVLLHEFARDLDAYLATWPEGAPIRTMGELVAWNDAHADQALKYGQVLLERALAVDHDGEHTAYLVQRARDLAVAAEHGIDATLALADASAIIFPGPHGCGEAARAGYPSLVVPAGYRRENRWPVGMTLVGPVAQRARAAGPRCGVRGSGEGPQAAVGGQPVAVSTALDSRRRIAGHWVSSVARWVVSSATCSVAWGTRSAPPAGRSQRPRRPGRRPTPKSGRRTGRVEVPATRQQGGVAEVALGLDQRLPGQVADELRPEGVRAGRRPTPAGRPGTGAASASSSSSSGSMRARHSMNSGLTRSIGLLDRAIRKVVGHRGRRHQRECGRAFGVRRGEGGGVRSADRHPQHRHPLDAPQVEQLGGVAGDRGVRRGGRASTLRSPDG